MQPEATPTISLKVEVWNVATRAQGLLTDKAKAEAFGVSRAYINRLQNGHTAPTIPFMSAACAKLGLGMDDLFKVVRVGRAA